ncbi:MAG: DUF3793 family protein [Oscillospiraceae bacterium]|nr:DUF3793 family protein [Oscillospiraceae bacterium]
MPDLLEKELALHCAPALAGIKAGNLLTLQYARVPNLPLRLEAYRAKFAGCGVSFCILQDSGKRILLLVYREELLKAHLAQPGARWILARAGYPQDGTLEALLAHLKLRLAEERAFPHEIGLFLEYPPADVAGFQHFHGQNCKLCGHWKVYADPVQAQARFARYDRCRNALCRKLEQGMTLTQLFACTPRQVDADKMTNHIYM